MHICFLWDFLFQRSPLPKLHSFDQNMYSKNSNIVKYYNFFSQLLQETFLIVTVSQLEKVTLLNIFGILMHFFPRIL